MLRAVVTVAGAAACALAVFAYLTLDQAPPSERAASDPIVLITGSTVPKAQASPAPPRAAQPQASPSVSPSGDAPLPASAAEPPAAHRIVIDRRDERVEIAGHVARDEQRAILEEAARRHFPTDALDIEVVRMDEAAFDPHATLAALAALARLAEGTAEIGPNGIALSGRALYAQLPGLVAARLGEAAPEGWPVSLDIAAPDRAVTNGEAVCQEEIAARLEEEQIGFAVAAATIAEHAEPLLDDLAEILGQCPEAAVEVAGHTDSDGSAAANRRLSQQRAAAVRQALVARGIEAQRLSAVGYGQAQPVAPNDSSENKARNRRIEIVVID